MRKGRKRGVEKERGEIYRGERGGRGTGGGGKKRVEKERGSEGE